MSSTTPDTHNAITPCLKAGTPIEVDGTSWGLEGTIAHDVMDPDGPVLIIVDREHVTKWGRKVRVRGSLFITDVDAGGVYMHSAR